MQHTSSLHTPTKPFSVILLTSFGGLALLLTTTGIYGVLAYTMNRRTAEIGLRVALGASRRNVLGMVLSQGMRPALVGMLLGALGAWCCRATLRRYCSASSPLTFSPTSR